MSTSILARGGAEMQPDYIGESLVALAGNPFAMVFTAWLVLWVLLSVAFRYRPAWYWVVSGAVCAIIFGRSALTWGHVEWLPAMLTCWLIAIVAFVRWTNVGRIR